MYGVTRTYHTWSEAGDQYCGHVISGLGVNSVKFAMQAPHFMKRQEKLTLINEGIALVYPGRPGAAGSGEWNAIAGHLLASLVFHHDWLRKILPANHPLFETEEMGHNRTMAAEVDPSP